jgi:hypothetical protein
VVRRITLRQLKETFGHTKLQVGQASSGLFRVPCSCFTHAPCSPLNHLPPLHPQQGLPVAQGAHPTQHNNNSLLPLLLLHPLPKHTAQDLDFSTVLAPKAEALFDELSDVLAPYYMGANSPLSADDQQVRVTSLLTDCVWVSGKQLMNSPQLCDGSETPFLSPYSARRGPYAARRGWNLIAADTCV